MAFADAAMHFRFKLNTDVAKLMLPFASTLFSFRERDAGLEIMPITSLDFDRLSEADLDVSFQ
jgi:hypothetical protein